MTNTWGFIGPEKIKIPAYKIKAVERSAILEKSIPRVLSLTVLAGSAKEAKKLVRDKYRIVSIERAKPIIYVKNHSI